MPGQCAAGLPGDRSKRRRRNPEERLDGSTHDCEEALDHGVEGRGGDDVTVDGGL